MILINLFLSLSSETVFRRRPLPIAVSAVAYANCTNSGSWSQSSIQCIKTRQIFFSFSIHYHIFWLRKVFHNHFLYLHSIYSQENSGSLWEAHFSKNSVSLERIEIFQFRLKIWHLWRLPHPWVGVWVVGCMGGWVYGWLGVWVVGCMGGWVYGWVNGLGQVKSLKSNKPWPNRDISILFEDLISVKTPPPMGGWLGVWVG